MEGGHPHWPKVSLTGPVTTDPASPSSEQTKQGRVFSRLLAATRITTGWIFLWSFLDSAFGLRINAVAGTAIVVMMWAGSLPPAQPPGGAGDRWAPRVRSPLARVVRSTRGRQLDAGLLSPGVDSASRSAAPRSP